MPDNSTTALSASAANLAGDSTCSNSLTYVELGAAGPAGGSPDGGAPGGSIALGSPATWLDGLRSKFRVGAAGILLLGTGTNPPTSSTTQKLVARVPGSSARWSKRRVIGSGRTAIPAGGRRTIRLKLNRRGKRLLRERRRLTGELSIVARGPSGLRATVRKAVRLTAKRPRR